MRSQHEIRQEITNQIVQSLKNGVVPWRKPWKTLSGPSSPTNFLTRKRYLGINIPLLWLTSSQKGYEVDFWGTYRQWELNGAFPKKGEKATQIVFWKPVQKMGLDADGNRVTSSFPILRTFNVFNIHQVSGGGIEQQLSLEPAASFEHEKRSRFQEAVSATGAKIIYGGGVASYRPSTDLINMPDEDRFDSFPAFADTLLHELAHWTEPRLKWAGSYAEGELRAEMSAAFSTAALGIHAPIDQSAAYISGWLKALQDDSRVLLRASSAASKASDFILSFSRSADEAAIQEA